MKSAIQVLIEARSMIEQEAQWTKYTHAKTSCGRRTEIESPEAVCWCANGAVDLASQWHGENVRLEAVEMLSKVIEGDTSRIKYPKRHTPTVMVTIYNDSEETEHRDILAMFDKAIANYKNKNR